MKPNVAYAGSRLAAERLFASSSALQLVPPPNQSVEDLNRHCRRVLGVERVVHNPQPWRVAA